mmetsp:Transcript_123370/g.217454  ORF Transcript_123370/g.217454 Transcript_123370/m.217454 type:complete len:501 (-) Transcript_123370:20-1522(-)
MPVVELFLDKRGEALGNTFLSEYEDEVLDQIILTSCRKRSRSWAHSKRRPEFFDDSATAFWNVQGEGTSHFEGHEQPMMTQQIGQHIANDQLCCTNMGWHASPSPDNENKIFELDGFFGPTIYPHTTHFDHQPPTIQPDTTCAQGPSQQCIVNQTLPALPADIWHKDLWMGGAIHDGPVFAPKQPSPSPMPEVPQRSLGLQTEATTTNQASEDVEQKFLEFVDQLKAAKPKQPAAMQGRAAPQCSSRACTAPEPFAPGPLPSVDSWLAQLQQQLGEGNSRTPQSASAMSPEVLPVGLVSNGSPQGSLMPSEVTVSPGQAQKFHNCGLNEDAAQEIYTGQNQDSYLSKFKTLGIVSEWQLPAHPEIPEGCTVMVRNLAESTPVKKILEQIEILGLGRHVQCFYMPCTFSDKRPVSNGYAFVNFDCQVAAEVLEDSWHDALIFYPWQFSKHSKNSNRKLNISRAKVQGLRQNLLAWSRSKTSRIKNEFFRPMLFNGAMRFGE